jgi:hypothetical protein
MSCGRTETYTRSFGTTRLLIYGKEKVITEICIQRRRAMRV